ncbi:MAG: formylglycine-generating enzyme family protein [Desulfuromonas sp.]|nr:MAG: formylglycine-generating enzyme family protein [Desulfuromonas sp.]
MKKKMLSCKTIFSILSFLLVSLLSGSLHAELFAKTHTDPTTGMEFIHVPGGCYEMGNKWGGGSYTEYPVHEVCLGDFYIGKTEVTQGQWEKIMGSNPSYFKLGDNYPVESISRPEIYTFLHQMNQKNAKGFRLPTEAEWEYACRSGGRDQEFCGGDSPQDFAWYEKNSDDIPHPVAQKQANGLGLFDMSGNVWEFCSDIFARDYYETGPKHNPIGAKSGRHLMKRGGSWGVNDNFVRSATRGRGSMEEKHYSTGFRVVFPALFLKPTPGGM